MAESWNDWPSFAKTKILADWPLKALGVKSPMRVSHVRRLAVAIGHVAYVARYRGSTWQSKWSVRGQLPREIYVF